MRVSPKISKRFLVFIPVFVFALFFLCLKFDKNQILYSSFPESDDEFWRVKTRRVEQGFEIGGDHEGFNGISIAVFNPSNQDIPCSFILKTRKGGRIIGTRELNIEKGTDTFNTVRASFPTVAMRERKTFYFELKAPSPFFILASTEEAVEGSFPVSINREDFPRQILFRSILSLA